ncbi:MAG: hypothetical protein K2N30_00880 [Clostridia bacterium]|nr:hypothetical protein [Clostridia bacterium]
MKAQMRFQKYICLAMIIVGALATFYAFIYGTGALSELGYTLNNKNKSYFTASKGLNDATLYLDIQPFNTALMYCGIVMILLAVVLYITASHKRRNYYISNIVATSVCAGGNIIMSLVLLVMNGIWRDRFSKVDFEAWNKFWTDRLLVNPASISHYNDSTVIFDLGFAVYVIVILASVALILNLIWKIKLMQGEKKLLEGGQLTEVQAA